MGSSSFQMSNFRPVDGTMVVIDETSATFNFPSAYAVGVHVDLWAEDNSWAANGQDAALDGGADQSVAFDIPQTNLHYQITVTGEDGSENTVYVSIEW